MTIFNHNFNGFAADTDLGDIPNWLRLAGASGNVKINAIGTLTLANSQACYVTMVDSSDFTYTITFSAAMISHPAKIVFRAMDERHFLGIGYLTADGGFSIYKCVAGTTTKISNIAITAPAIGDVWKVVCVGDTIKVYINDVLKFDIVETKYQYVNAVGFRTLADSNLNNMIDSISIDTVPVASTGLYKSSTIKRIIGGFT